MINKVLLIGNLGRDPEIRRLESGAAVAKFSIATNENYKDKSGEWQTITEWHNIVAWRGLAERAERDLKKGGMVAIIGFVALLVLFFVGYAMSTDVLPAGAEKYIDGSGYKLANGGLITCYVLIVVAAVLSFLGLVKGLVTGN